MPEGITCPFCNCWLDKPQRHDCGKNGWLVTFRKERGYKEAA